MSCGGCNVANLPFLSLYLSWNSESGLRLNHLCSCTHAMRCSPSGNYSTLQWRRNERHGISNHRQFDWLFNRLFRLTLEEYQTRITDPLRWESLTRKMFPFGDVSGTWFFDFFLKSVQAFVALQTVGLMSIQFTGNNYLHMFYASTKIREIEWVHPVYFCVWNRPLLLHA